MLSAHEIHPQRAHVALERRIRVLFVALGVGQERVGLLEDPFTGRQFGAWPGCLPFDRPAKEIEGLANVE
jgi:hypothetical protein